MIVYSAALPLIMVQQICNSEFSGTGLMIMVPGTVSSNLDIAVVLLRHTYMQQP